MLRIFSTQNTAVGLDFCVYFNLKVILLDVDTQNISSWTTVTVVGQRSWLIVQCNQ